MPFVVQCAVVGVRRRMVAGVVANQWLDRVRRLSFVFRLESDQQAHSDGQQNHQNQVRRQGACVRQGARVGKRCGLVSL